MKYFIIKVLEMLETLFGITPKRTLRTHLIMILESAFNVFFNLKFFIFQVLKKLETFSIITTNGLLISNLPQKYFEYKHYQMYSIQ